VIAFSRETLDNGLDVIVHEDHAVPLVAVNVWYHVGSKNEVPGRTGLAHLFEHLMFKGAEHQPRGYFEPLQEAGGTLNGSTNCDRTNYWEVVPASAARLALWMEADRMGWLVPALSDERFQTEREVVLNERRESYENRPYGLAGFAVVDALYPAGHPYHTPTIGAPEDLRAATVDDARAFFERYYHPHNASLVIAGDISTAEAMRLARELFGEIPAGPPVAPVPHAPLTPRAQRLVLEDEVALARLYLSWPAAALFGPGDAELDLIADLIGNGRTSRLYRRLVHEERIATELQASQASRELGGFFQVIGTAAPGHTLAEIDDAVRAALIEFRSLGPTVDEVVRGRAQAEAAFVHRLQMLGGFGGKADQLNAYNIYCGTPGYFETDLERYLRADADRLQATAVEFLDPDGALALSVVPKGQATLALSDSQPVEIT
jgi:zinc protease